MNGNRANYVSIADYRVILIGIGLAGLWWFIESSIHFFVFQETIRQVLSPDEHEMWMRSFVAVLFLIFGTYAQRITSSRRQAEESLRVATTRAEEEKLKSEAIITSIGDGLCILDTDFKVLYGNKALEDAYGKHTGEYCYVAYQSKDQVCEGCPVAASFKDGKIHTREMTVQTEEVIRYIENTASPLRDSTGKIIAGIEVVRDITERKEIEQALQESKELFEKTFMSQRDAIFILNTEIPPTIIDCNPAATEVFGYTDQEMVGRTTSFLHVDETALQEFRRQIYHAIEKDVFFYLDEFKMRRKDGKVIPTEHSVMPLENEKGKRIGWVSVVRDITERRRAEKEL